jgi:hypothetical protein
VIFAVEEDGPLNLVSYRPKEALPDFRPAIREDNLADAPVSAPSQETAAAPAKVTKASPKTESAKPESPSLATLKPAPREIKVESKSSIAPAQKSPVVAAKPAASSTIVQMAKAAERAHAEEVAVNQQPDRAPALTDSVEATKAQPVLEPKIETTAVAPQVSKVPVKPMAPAPVQDMAAVPGRSLSSTSANDDGLSTKSPEMGPREAVKSAAPAPATAKTPAAVIPAPVVTARVQDLPDPEKVAVPTPTASAEKVVPTMRPRIENVRPTDAPQPTAMKAREAVAIPPPVAEVPSPSPAVEVDKPSIPVNAATKETAPLPAKEPAVVLTAPQQEKIAAPPAAVKTVEPLQQSTVTKPSASVHSSSTDRTPIETKSAPPTIVPAKPEIVAVPVVKAMEPAARPVVPVRPSVSAVAAKPETTPAVESKPALITSSKPTELPAREQLALLTNKPVEVTPPKPALTRPAVKSLEGFIIQLAFSDREKAQRWAESMEKRGYAVSLTEAGAEGSLRVRLGNFSVRDDAERQLRTFKQEGMNGIIINLPQAYRPEARTSIP